jgi:hypothetical protein
LTSILLLICILLTKDTFSRVFTLFSLLGIKMPSENYYSRKVIPDVDIAVQKILDTFLEHCKYLTPDKAICILL